MKQMIQTEGAPQPIGAYSQAVKVKNMLFLSGQIPKCPKTNRMIEGDIAAETRQVFDNLAAVAKSVAANLNNIVKLTIFLTDLSHFPIVNQIMEEYFAKPFPARSTIQVSALPAAARIEIEGILILD